jgi:hypothetical protein
MRSIRRGNTPLPDEQPDLLRGRRRHHDAQAFSMKRPRGTGHANALLRPLTGMASATRSGSAALP